MRLAAEGSKSEEQHAVAIAEKPVLFLDRVSVSGQNMLSSTKGANKHQQRGLRKVEVGEEAANYLKFMAWTEEDAGLAGVWLQGFSLRDRRAVLQCACGGCASGYDAITYLF